MTKKSIFQLIKKNIQEIIPDVDSNAIEIQQSLKEIGADSVDRVEIISMTLEDLGLKIPLIKFAEVKNMEELTELLANCAGC